MGIAGACRCNELVNLSITNIKDKGGYLYVTIPDTKTYVPRKFTVIQEGYPVNAVELYRKYVSLRPVNAGHVRLFVKYSAGRCTKQPVGINTLSKIPTRIASYLGLPEPGRFTGHSLRRSSATLLANGGGDLLSLKRLGGWKSSTTAEGYIEDCVTNKLEIAKKIQGVMFQEEPSTSSSGTDMQTTRNKVTSASTLSSNNYSLSSLNIENDNNNTLSFNINVNINLNK